MLSLFHVASRFSFCPAMAKGAYCIEFFSIEFHEIIFYSTYQIQKTKKHFAFHSVPKDQKDSYCMQNLRMDLWNNLRFDGKDS